MLRIRPEKISHYREIDYFQLKSALAGYANPHAKIRQWLASKALIRVKKGLYVVGKEYNDTPIAQEVLANLIYGPSAISLDYALAHYGLIPEHTHIVTSITPQRDKMFDTPAGHFSYRYLTIGKYPVGLTQKTLDDGRHVLIATPEKALADKIYFSRALKLQNNHDIESFLFEDLRLDNNIFFSLNKKLFQHIAVIYKNTEVSAVSHYLQGK